MIKLNIKPLSVNDAWQGRRFKSKKYKAYEPVVFYKLPEIKDFPQGRLSLSITWGFSNKASDVDNCAKPFIDILQKRYKFNDRNIFELRLTKQIVPKGQEFVQFTIAEI